MLRSILSLNARTEPSIKSAHESNTARIAALWTPFSRFFATLCYDGPAVPLAAKIDVSRAGTNAKDDCDRCCFAFAFTDS